jgi:multidrug efflux system outer membrane protein
MPRLMSVLTLAVALAACTTTPTAPPQLDLPTGTASDPPLERWWTAFNDPTLTALVDEALAKNLDLRAAITRVDAARAGVTAAQGYLYPTVNLGVDAGRSRISQVGPQAFPGIPPVFNDYRVGVNASYEVDLWGKYRGATRAAQDDLLASQYARETVRTAVAAEVSQAYFQLLAADAQLKLLRDTLKSRNDTVSLQRDRYQGGIVGEFDLATAEAERAAVASDIAVVQRAIGELESALAVLLGRSPREVFNPQVAREVEAVRLLAVPSLPEGLPSNLLERRPDIRSAEASLAAASRRIDVARADYFPSLALTGAYGTESVALHSLFTGPAAIWSIGAALAQPLLNFNQIQANVESRTAQRDQSVIGYQQTVQTAFKETHDALVANQTTRDALAAQSERTAKLQRALDLAQTRYDAGYSPYLEVLDAQRQLLQAQTLQILAARDVRIAVVDLAKAMGGGWEYRTAVAGS